MDNNEHLLTCLSEECAEIVEPCAALIAAASRVALRTSKAVRFGTDEIQPGQGQTNAERLVAELNDLLGVAELLVDAGILVGLYDRNAIEAKKAKVRAFMGYAEQCGAITKPASG